MPILGPSNSAANKNMMLEIWTNGVQLSNWVKNFEGKEEIARHKQFLLFPQYFKSCLLLMRQNEYFWNKGFNNKKVIIKMVYKTLLSNTLKDSGCF